MSSASAALLFYRSRRMIDRLSLLIGVCIGAILACNGIALLIALGVPAHG